MYRIVLISFLYTLSCKYMDRCKVHGNFILNTIFYFLSYKCNNLHEIETILAKCRIKHRISIRKIICTKIISKLHFHRRSWGRLLLYLRQIWCSFSALFWIRGRWRRRWLGFIILGEWRSSCRVQRDFFLSPFLNQK